MNGRGRAPQRICSQPFVAAANGSRPARSPRGQQFTAAAWRFAARRLRQSGGKANLSPLMPASRLALIALGGATFVALVNASQTYLSMMTHGHSFVRLFAWQFATWSIWGVVAPWIIRASSRPGALRLAQLVGLGVILCGAQGLAAGAFTVWLHPFTPVATYSYWQAVALAWPSVIVLNPIVYGLLVVGGRALAAQERARQLELRQAQLEAEVTRAQLDALRLEIQPHFLFNALNSIAALIRTKDNAAALSMLVGLSELMRSTLDRDPTQLLPLADEVALLERYVAIQRTRFGDRLDVAYSIAKDCETAAVPAFLLQPIVENALRHGLADGRPCRIEIGAANGDGATMRIWVTDNGKGLPPGFDLARDAGTGLGNTRARIQRLYGEGASLVLGSQPGGGTSVELILPRAPLVAALSA